MIKKLDSDDWETYAPYGIPAATASGVLSGIWYAGLCSVRS